MVPDRHRFSRVFVRAARAARNLPQGGANRRLDLIHHQLVSDPLTSTPQHHHASSRVDVTNRRHLLCKFQRIMLPSSLDERRVFDRGSTSRIGAKIMSFDQIVGVFRTNDSVGAHYFDSLSRRKE